MEYNLKVTQEDLNVLMSALLELQAKFSHNLINKFQQQLAGQTTTKPVEVPALVKRKYTKANGAAHPAAVA